MPSVDRLGLYLRRQANTHKLTKKRQASGAKSHDHTTDPQRKIMCLPKVSFSKRIDLLAVWHLTSSCWDQRRYTSTLSNSDQKK